MEVVKLSIESCLNFLLLEYIVSFNLKQGFNQNLYYEKGLEDRWMDEAIDGCTFDGLLDWSLGG